MALRKPSTKKIGVKVLTTGNTGTGKSLFGLSFPKIAALDSEAGLALYEGTEVGENIVVIDNTMSVTDLESTFTEIEEMLEDDPNSIATLVIDSETKFYQNLQHSCLDVEERRAVSKGGDVNDTNLSVRSWGRIKQVAQRLQNLKIDLSAKGVNIISVSQVEDVKKKVGENFVKIGEKPVMPKNSEYDYDIIIDLFIEKDENGNEVYKGVIKKDRTRVTKVGDVFENPSYDIWKSHLEGRKDADTISSSLTKDLDKDKKALEQEDHEKENPIDGVNVERNKELAREILEKSNNTTDEIKKKVITYMTENKVSLKAVDTTLTSVYEATLSQFN